MALFSIPPFPNATQYAIQFSDPTAGDPNAPNPLGPWTALPASPLTTASNIVDSAGDQNLRLYRAAPTVTVNNSPYVLPWYQPFSVAMSDPGLYSSLLFDPQITALLPAFREFLGDHGIPQSSSTQINMDSGAGTGLLLPDGTTKVFALADVPDAEPAIVLENSVQVIQNGKTKLLGTDYYVKYDAGQIIFATAPSNSDVITINFTEVRYTNRVLNHALSNAVERLGSVGISGYGLHYDNNVCLLNGTLGDTGIRYIVFYIAQKILNHALIWAKAQAARAYKSQDFQMDTAPSRVIEGMSAQTQVEFEEIRQAVYRFNRTNTTSFSFADYDSYLNINGLLPSFSAVWLLSPYSSLWI